MHQAWSCTLLLAASVVAQPGHSRPQHLVCSEDWTYFSGNRLTSGVELLRYKADEVVPLQALSDLVPGPCSSFPSQITPVVCAGTTRVFFTARTASQGEELALWVEGAPVQVFDLRPGLGSHPRELTVIGQRLFFTAAVDESNEQRRKLFELALDPGCAIVGPAQVAAASGLRSVYGLVATADGKLFFGATDIAGGGCDSGGYLYDPGVPVLHTIVPEGGNPSDAVAIGAEVFFASGASALRVLTAVDASLDVPTATELSLCAPACSDPAPDFLTVSGDRLILRATTASGRELKSYDPANGNVATISLGGKSANDVTWIAGTDSETWFAARGAGVAEEVWRWQPGNAPVRAADPAAGGISKVRNLATTAAGELLFAGFHRDSGDELWRVSSGSQPQVSLVADIMPGEAGSFPSRPVSGPGGSYLFAAEGQVASGGEAFGAPTGRELGETDGASAASVFNVNPGLPSPTLHLPPSGFAVNGAPPGSHVLLVFSPNPELQTLGAFASSAFNAGFTVPGTATTLPAAQPSGFSLSYILPGSTGYPFFSENLLHVPTELDPIAGAPTQPNGTASFPGRFGPPVGTAIVVQGLVFIPGTTFPVATTNPMSTGDGGVPITGGVVQAEGDYDDPPGDFRIRVRMLEFEDAAEAATTHYVAVALRIFQPGSREIVLEEVILATATLEPSSEIIVSGTADLQLPVIFADGLGHQLIMVVSPNPISPDKILVSPVVFSSYC